VLLALLGGAAFDTGRPFYPADIAAALAAVPAPRALVTTPFHLKALLRAGLALPPCALVLSATAPLSPQLAAEAEAALQGPLVEIYGCTEAGQVASRRTTEGETWTTLRGLRIERREGGDDGETGERFIVSGGHVVEPTPLADVLELQDATHFRLLGRANDLIHVAGKRSSLAHLNFHLNRIEGVEDGSFWLPHEDGEQVARTIAFVVAPRLGAAQIVAALRERLEPVFVPRRVVFVDALPREATGKLTAQALREFALRTLGRTDPTAPTPPSAPTVAPDRNARAAPAGPEVVLHADGSASTQLEVPADHPAFAGHFPGRPLLPGVMLLSWALQALDAAPALRARLGSAPCIDSVKFLAAVLPGTTLALRLAPQGRGVGFELQCGATPVARGLLAPGGDGA
jgi:3-hydroxymyristoyl/3-hydroxydecanoyl-(acyl carrier protein) dehydratase